MPLTCVDIFLILSLQGFFSFLSSWLRGYLSSLPILWRLYSCLPGSSFCFRNLFLFSCDTRYSCTDPVTPKLFQQIFFEHLLCACAALFQVSLGTTSAWPERDHSVSGFKNCNCENGMTIQHMCAWIIWGFLCKVCFDFCRLLRFKSNTVHYLHFAKHSHGVVGILDKYSLLNTFMFPF